MYPQTDANPMHDFSFSLSLQPGPVLQAKLNYSVL